MCGILDIAKLTPETSAILLLPSEVMDLVIDQLREDEATLRVCSLVCQGWLPRARHHLFSILKLNDHTRLLCAQRLLQSPLCTIHPHVRGLKLCIDPSDIAPIVTLIQEVNARSTLLLLKMRTATGAGLTLVDDDLRGILSTLKNLRYLKLQFFSFSSLEDRIRLIASLPALETLVIYGVKSDNYDADSYSGSSQNSLMHAVPPPENLRHVFIGAADIPHELHWLAAHRRHPLTTLHLHSLTLEFFPLVLDYLRQSSQLRCLSFDFLKWKIPEDLQSIDLMAQIDLTSQQDLRCLRLNSTQVVPLLSKLLPRVRSLRIEEITISTDARYVGSVWADLREIFTAPAVRDLERLYVDEGHINEISEALPGLASRGVILPLHPGDFKRETAELCLPSIL